MTPVKNVKENNILYILPKGAFWLASLLINKLVSQNEPLVTISKVLAVV